jgi:hypothetical protein
MSDANTCDANMRASNMLCYRANAINLHLQGGGGASHVNATFMHLQNEGGALLVNATFVH